jgi:hypothetical protein
LYANNAKFGRFYKFFAFGSRKLDSKQTIGFLVGSISGFLCESTNGAFALVVA